MKKIKYFIQFLFIILFFKIFKFLGYKKSSDLGGFIFKLFGSLFRSKTIVKKNFSNLKKRLKNIEYNKSINEVWENYGRIFSDYVFLEKFRKGDLDQFVKIQGLDVLNQVKIDNQPVVFISGHFNNFELMAMYIEKNKIDISAIYRPLNNLYLNKVMENIRRNFICRKQIPKGKAGTRKLLKSFKEGSSIAIMIDQRVSEGEKIPFFDKQALTTTIPAQLVKKFNCKVVPVHIQRDKKYYFTISFLKPLNIDNKNTLEEISLKLNLWLEKMILKQPTQWIWTHNRWKL